MAFRVEVRAARHAVAKQHLRLPINVLLALPEIRENTAVEQLFNLPSAINLLLGSEGWYRATRVMRPMLLAPDWDNDVLHAFLSNAPLSPNRGPMDVNRLVEERIFGYMLKPGKVDPTTPRFAIRHYAAAGGANQGDAVGWMPVFPSDREAPILGTLARGEGRFIEAFDEMTRLVILQRPYGFIDSWARDFAGSLVKQGGPAVLIVAATDPLQAHAYLVDVYAGIIHNRPLQEAVAPRTPYPIEIEFWHGKGSEHLLTFDGWLNELRVGIESLRSRHAGFTKDLSNRTQNASPYLHRTTLQRITMDVESTRDEIAARLDTLDHKLDFARETRGVFPLLDMSTKRAREMRFWSDPARFWALLCFNFAEWYSAFSLRSPSSRAFWIVCGMTVRSSRSRSSSSRCSIAQVARVMTGLENSSACSPTWLKSASVFFWRWSSTHCFSSGMPTRATASSAGNRSRSLECHCRSSTRSWSRASFGGRTPASMRWKAPPSSIQRSTFSPVEGLGFSSISCSAAMNSRQASSGAFGAETSSSMSRSIAAG